MEANWIIIAIVLILSIALIILVIVRNQKDKEEVVESLNAEDEHERNSDELE